MDTNAKTPNGLQFSAYQGRNLKKEIPVKAAGLFVSRKGKMTVVGTVGEDRGTSLKIEITLEEVLAWLPALAERAKGYAVEKDTDRQKKRKRPV